MAQPEPAADGWVVHADESGSPDLHRADPQFPVFVVAFCLSRTSDYAQKIVPAITELKLKHFGHDAVVLHEYDIRNIRAPFVFGSDEAQIEFMEDLADFVAAAPVRFTASLIDKRAVPDKLAPWLDGYGVCFEHGVSRIARVLQRESGGLADSALVRIVAESRGKRENSRLEGVFNASLSINENRRANRFELVIADKALNLPGLQLADLAAHPIARHYLKPDQPNRAWEAIRDKLIGGPDGGAELVDLTRLTQ